MALFRGRNQIQPHVLIMAKFLSTILYCIIWVISLLPLPVLYLFSDLAWLLMYICPPLRYRKNIVRNNLALSFPDKDKKWLRLTERRFYYQFACQIMESIKTASVGPRWIKRHMEFTGYEAVRKEAAQGQPQIFYLGHVGNWEWIPSLNLYFNDMDNVAGCQVYHRLENETMDLFMLKLRGRFGTESIPMEQTMRRLIQYRKEGKAYLIGMISDQVPLWWNIHYWTQFMNRKTPVFTGAERISRKMDAGVWYFHVTRKRRGYYRCDMIPMYLHTAELPDYAVTEKYMRMLEDNIRQCPELWLWTHNRWKRTWEGYQNWLSKHKNSDRERSIKE